MPAIKPFKRLLINFTSYGNTRVEWEINPHFLEPEPWAFQLQFGETSLPSYKPDNSVRTDDWVDLGATVINTFFKVDPDRRAYGKLQNIFYRVKLTTGLGDEFYSEPGEPFGRLNFRDWHLLQELLRKEQIRHQHQVSPEGFLLKAKRSGTPCPVCLDPFTGEVTDSKCSTCFGNRWVGGYYDPVPKIYMDIQLDQSNEQRNLSTGEGMDYSIITSARFTATPQLAHRDIWVNKYSDERYIIRSVKTRSQIRGVQIIVECELRKLPYDDIVYSIEMPSDE